MHDLPLITTIAAAFTAAWLLGLLTQRLGLSPIVGYLLAGVLIGPHSPGFVGDVDLAHQLAEVGVILLMFGVGLHFHLKDLLAVKSVAIPGAIGQSLVATLLGIAVFAALGLPVKSGAVIGMAMAVASTVVLMRVLMDADALNTPQGHVAVGWLLVEDVFTVIILVLIPVLGTDASAAEGATRPGLWASLGLALLKLSALVAIVMLGGSRAIPWVLVQVARLRLARAVHAHGAGLLDRDRGRLVRLLRRVDGPRGVPGGHGGRAIPGQSSGRGRCAADARCLRRAVLRVGGDALRPGIRRPRATDDPGGAGHHPDRQAVGCAAHRRAARPFGPHRADRRAGPGADRRVLVHPFGAGPQTWPDARVGAQRAGRRGDYLDHAEPDPVPLIEPDRGPAAPPSAVVDAAQRPRGAAGARPTRTRRSRSAGESRRGIASPWSSGTARWAARCTACSAMRDSRRS